MFVDLSEYYVNKVYKMLNMETEMIINSWDSIWFHKVHKD
jgi:hypothetical protein